MSRCTSAMATRAGQSTAWVSLIRALVPKALHDVLEGVKMPHNPPVHSCNC
jgi:hypothetical protein